MMKSDAAGSQVLVYIGEQLARYGFGHGHPFGPDRMDAFWQEAIRQGLDKQVVVTEPCLATESTIRRFHTNSYIERVKNQSKSGEGFLDSGDTPSFKGMFEAASTVAGCVCDAVDRLRNGEAKRAFVPIAGLHHARRNMAAGFCVFNDCGILIEHLKAEHHLSRIAYIDIDAHHGDGVFYAFESDPAVWIADIHEDGHYLYPGSGFTNETGKAEASGTKLNLPMAPDSGDAAFMDVWRKVEAHILAARPEFIILQCGADSIADDPITHLHFSPSAHAHAAASLCRIADEFCNGQIIALGGGGYNRHNLAAAWTAVLSELIAV
jgi:acetoin utilization protein AcuC